MWPRRAKQPPASFPFLASLPWLAFPPPCSKISPPHPTSSLVKSVMIVMMMAFLVMMNDDGFKGFNVVAGAECFVSCYQ